MDYINILSKANNDDTQASDIIYGIDDYKLRRIINDKLMDYIKETSDRKHSLVLFGLMHEHGILMVKNINKAFELYQKAAELKNGVASYYLGVMYSDSRYTKKDINTSKKWYKNAFDIFKKEAKLGYGNAMYYVGKLYYYDNDINRNEQKAHKWFARAASIGNDNAMYELASKLNINCCEKDELVFEWYLKAAILGNDNAIYTIGMQYKNDQIPEKFKKKYGTVVEWWKMALEFDNDSAMYELGKIYEKGNGIEQNYRTAIDLYQKAIEFGNSNAMYRLGLLHENGFGVEQNYDIAIELYRTAIDQDNDKATYHLGTLYYQGRGLIHDHKKAIELYHQAAKQGNINALYDLGDMYSEGNGIEKNHKKAIKMYRKAHREERYDDEISEYEWITYSRFDDDELLKKYGKAKKIYLTQRGIQKSYAARFLAQIYMHRTIIGQNIEKALKLYSECVRLGNDIAICELANIYYKGKHVKKDHQKAMELYQLAFELKNGNAAAKLAKIYMRDLGNHQKAIEICNEAIEFRGDNNDAVFFLVNMYTSEVGICPNYQKVIETYEKAIKINEKYDEYYNKNYYTDRCSDFIIKLIEIYCERNMQEKLIELSEREHVIYSDGRFSTGINKLIQVFKEMKMWIPLAKLYLRVGKKKLFRQTMTKFCEMTDYEDSTKLLKKSGTELSDLIFHKKFDKMYDNKPPILIRLLRNAINEKIDLIEMHFQYTPDAEGCKQAKLDFMDRINKN